MGQCPARVLGAVSGECEGASKKMELIWGTEERAEEPS
jgi:hypothetical protein